MKYFYKFDFHKLADVISGIAQKTFYIASSIFK